MQAPSVLQESASIKEAAQILGYQQQSHFARDFKEMHGKTPREYSAQHAVTVELSTRTLSQLDKNVPTR
jgi:AraC-like DNA-binding protein